MKQVRDYQMASVEEYIGTAAKNSRFGFSNFNHIHRVQSAAEKIVEGYMGQYMERYMNEWYIQYCR